MGIMLTWAADVARRAVAGTPYQVIEVPGWQTRGHGGYRVVEGIVGHHTGGPKTGEFPSLRVVRDGRADLPGPLCTYGLGRSGAIYVNAAGVAWHAGASAACGFTDLNDEFGGVEAESTGGGDWTPAQLDCYPRLVGAFLAQIRRGSERYVSHRGCALPPGRKPDPKGIEDAWMRARAQAWMSGTPATSPISITPTTKGGKEVMIENYPVSGRGVLPLIVPVGKASSITEVGFISTMSTGPRPGLARAWFQSDTGGISDSGSRLNCAWADGRSARPYMALPDTTTMIRVEYDFPDGGTICIETQGR